MTQTKSPTPKEAGTHKPAPKAKPVDFFAALKAIVDGSTVTRKDWKDKTIYGFMRNDQLMIRINGEDHIWTVDKADITATDWLVLP